MNNLFMAGSDQNSEVQLRKAALLLYAMALGDQSWLLSQLPEGQSARLRELLAELVQMKVPANANSFDTLLDTDVRQPINNENLSCSDITVSGLGANSVSNRIQYWDRVGPLHLYSVMRDEPISIIVFFLCLHKWRWRNQFLGQFDASKRRKISETLLVSNTTDRLNGKLTAAVILEIYRRVDRLDQIEKLEKSQVSPSESFWRRFLSSRLLPPGVAK